MKREILPVEVWAVINRHEGTFLSEFYAPLTFNGFGSHFVFHQSSEKANLFLFKHSAEKMADIVKRRIGIECTVLRMEVHINRLKPKDEHETVLLKIWKRIKGRKRK